MIIIVAKIHSFYNVTFSTIQIQLLSQPLEVTFSYLNMFMGCFVQHEQIPRGVVSDRRTIFKLVKFTAFSSPFKSSTLPNKLGSNQSMIFLSITQKDHMINWPLYNPLFFVLVQFTSNWIVHGDCFHWFSHSPCPTSPTWILHHLIPLHTAHCSLIMWPFFVRNKRLLMWPVGIRPI